MSGPSRSIFESIGREALGCRRDVTCRVTERMHSELSWQLHKGKVRTRGQRVGTTVFTEPWDHHKIDRLRVRRDSLCKFNRAAGASKKCFVEETPPSPAHAMLNRPSAR